MTSIKKISHLFKGFIILTAMVVMGLSMSSCSHIDNERVPYAPVYMTFATEGDWTMWGVSGAGQYRRYIRTEKVPEGYPYKATDYTGFGGLLVITNYYGDLQAYDLCCPFEAKYNVRINIDRESGHAICPQCKSEYDVFELQGYPVAGPARERDYGLRKYYIGRGRGLMEYMVITR